DLGFEFATAAGELDFLFATQPLEFVLGCLDSSLVCGSFFVELGLLVAFAIFPAQPFLLELAAIGRQFGGELRRELLAERLAFDFPALAELVSSGCKFLLVLLHSSAELFLLGKERFSLGVDRLAFRGEFRERSITN